MWIDAFFFRANAMRLPGERVAVTLEKEIPPIPVTPLTTVHGYVDYLGAITDESMDGKFVADAPTPGQRLIL